MQNPLTEQAQIGFPDKESPAEAGLLLHGDTLLPVDGVVDGVAGTLSTRPDSLARSACAIR